MSDVVVQWAVSADVSRLATPVAGLCGHVWCPSPINRCGEGGGADGNACEGVGIAARVVGVCKGNLTTLRRILHLDLAKGNPK
jgi:hypothetical protein